LRKNFEDVDNSSQYVLNAFIVMDEPLYYMCAASIDAKYAEGDTTGSLASRQICSFAKLLSICPTEKLMTADC
jgi:hypothetical protein